MSGNGGSGCSNLASQPKKVTKICVEKISKILALLGRLQAPFVFVTRRNSVGIRQRPDIEVGDTFLNIFGLWRTHEDCSGEPISICKVYVRVYGILKHLYLIFVSLLRKTECMVWGWVDAAISRRGRKNICLSKTRISD